MTANRNPSGLRSLLRKRVHLPPPDVSFIPHYELNVVSPETTLLPIPEPGILGLSGNLANVDLRVGTLDSRIDKPRVVPLELSSVFSPLGCFETPLDFGALETTNVLIGLDPVASQGSIFVKDQKPATQPSLDRTLAPRTDRSPGVAKPRTRDIFELLLPILMPPAQTEFGTEFLLPEDLYDYQRYGVKWLIDHEGALLADDMGLGKTVQAIIAFRVLIRQGQALQALVVCPKSILTNWSRELERWAPELMVTPISGARDVRRIKWQSLIGRSHVILATYETIREDSEAIRGRMFDLTVLDEIQKIKNPSAQVSQACRKLAAKRRWGLSGTPLENRIEEVVAIFRFLEPSLFSSTANLSEAKVKRAIPPHMLRRRKQDALKDLPGKVKDTKYLSLLPRQRAAYDRAETAGTMELKTGENVTIQHVLALITRLKQICNFEPTSGESAKLEFLEDYLEEV